MNRHFEVYMDESGDLGLSSRSSRYLVVVALVTSEAYRIARLVRKAHRRFGRYAKGGDEFKFNRSNEALREHFLRGIAETNSEIFWVAVTKRCWKDVSLSGSESLWFHVASRALSEASARTQAKSLRVTIDRFSSKPNANAALATRLAQTISSRHAGHFPPDVRMSLVESKESEGLQAADFVAGAVFQKIERKEDKYYRLISGRVGYGGIIR
ncbi:MAG TPA: DUF3800 domain-containing protein [Thermoplasmata archaeon]